MSDTSTMNINLGKNATGQVVVQISNGQGVVSQQEISPEEVKALMWRTIVLLATPGDPPPETPPNSSEGIPRVNNTQWMAGFNANGADFTVWIPGLGYCNFDISHSGCTELSQFFAKAAEMSKPAASPTPN